MLRRGNGPKDTETAKGTATATAVTTEATVVMARTVGEIMAAAAMTAWDMAAVTMTAEENTTAARSRELVSV